MNELAALSLAEALPLLAFQAALLFCRLGACCMLLPGLGEAEVPAPVRLAVPLALVVVLLPVLAPTLPALEPATAAELARLIASEVAIGLWLGSMMRLAALALAMAGQLVGFLIGLSSVLVPDPGMGGAGTALSRFFGLAAATLVLSTGLYAIPLRALAESYAVLPPGSPLAVPDAVASLADAIGWSLGLALRLAAPFVLLSLLVQGVGGLVGRVAPQTQAFILAAPAQALLGLLLLGALLPALLQHWAEATHAAWQILPVFN